jgi:hypothetical protein
MVKTTNPQAIAQVTPKTTFPIPFTLDAFQNDITEVFLHYVRIIACMTDADTAWGILKLPSENYSRDLFYVGLEAKDLGLTFEHIRHTAFAEALDRMYQYAYFGRKDHNQESMVYESGYTWITCLAFDARSGDMANEFDSYGWPVKDCGARCAQAAETANARITLEGEAPFYISQHPGKEGYLSEDVLTVRQLSLLSGMEEMSIRAAANPKRPNPLKTITTEHGTRIEIQVAKEWLMAKGRYVPISDVWSASEINLAKLSFESLYALYRALHARYQSFCTERGSEGMDAEFAQANIKTEMGVGPVLSMSPEDYLNDEQIRVVARVLELPVELLVLRFKETLARENLSVIEKALREATNNLP